MLSPKITGVRTPPLERKRFDLWIAVSFFDTESNNVFQCPTFNKKQKESKMNNNILQVQNKVVYGKDLVYPVCEKAKKFADLLCVKTFNDHHICKILDLGFKFELVVDSEFQRVLNRG